MIGKNISHFKIIEKLGEGGMGEVYKAEDTKLKRIVALKFLPSFLSSDKEANKRFILEAQSASALDHNNICTVYEIGETDNNQLFISMACYEGETLKEKIEKGKLNTDETLNITLQICEGLKKAHQNNITHRDIKPANIFITSDNVVKILDFGLAKVKGQTKLTQLGSTAGTIDYMSPEQARGEEVDQRTDIWALGIVFHEMLTGESLFKGDYEQAVIYSILNFDPDLGNVPKDLVPIIKKTIVKSPGERYQHISEMINDLISVKTNTKVNQYFALTNYKKFNTYTRLAGVFVIILAGLYFIIYNSSNRQFSSGEQERKMIVVLPFENLGAPEDEYFAQGMREEISNKLASLGGIGVISRSSAEKFANTKKSAKEIGKELGVDYILEGTVQWGKQNGKVNRVKIFPQLVSVSDDINIWSDSYDRIINDIFDLQNEIAQNVVNKLGIKILPAQFKNGAPPTKNLEAYDYYLKGNQMKYRVSSKADVYASIRLYEKAIELDPEFSGAYAQLAISYMGIYDRHYERDSSIVENIRRYLHKAEELDSNSVDVHLARAFYYQMIEYNPGMALKELNRTLELQPNYAEGYISLCVMNWEQSHYDLMIKYALKAFKLDPLSSRYAEWVADAYRWLRNYENSEIYLNRAKELSPNSSESDLYKANIYLDWKGNTGQAWQILNQLKNRNAEGADDLEISLNIFDRKFKKAIQLLKSLKREYYYYIPSSQMIALIYWQMKQHEQARKYFKISIGELEKMLAKDKSDVNIHYNLSISYAGLNDKEKALKEIHRAAELKPPTSFTKYLMRINQLKVYTLTGDYNDAIKTADSLLAKPSFFSVNKLKLDPFYDPLRNLPGYKAIIEKYSAE